MTATILPFPSEDGEPVDKFRQRVEQLISDEAVPGVVHDLRAGRPWRSSWQPSSI
jgi:hypothetical protein